MNVLHVCTLTVELRMDSVIAIIQCHLRAGGVDNYAGSIAPKYEKEKKRHQKTKNRRILDRLQKIAFKLVDRFLQ